MKQKLNPKIKKTLKVQIRRIKKSDFDPLKYEIKIEDIVYDPP